MAQFIAWAVLIFKIMLTTVENTQVSVTFDGRKSGNTVLFNCSIGTPPPSTTIQFLVDSVSANDVRLYNGKCYLTHDGNPCNIHQCQCSQDGKRYYWIYEEPKEEFTATCKAKINDKCTAYANIKFTASNLAPHGNRVTSCETSSTSSCVRGNIYIWTCIVLLISVILG